MNETQKRIRAYKKALPELRERVIAVALLLVMSAAMMTSATFAWITLSSAPEVTEVTTNIAANGNLEIALVKPDGSAPGESAIGDSSATPESDVPEDQRQTSSIVRSNVTWGNLVNLSDPAYGLEHIILRPALLGDEADLVAHPLKGVDYSADGRVMKNFNEDYQFTNWLPTENGGRFEFKMPQEYGVRAVSTVALEYNNDDYPEFQRMLSQPKTTQATVYDAYNAMIEKDVNINALAGLISIYIDDRMNDGGGNSNAAAHIPALYNLTLELQGIVDEFGVALFELANVQIFNKVGSAAYKDAKYDTPEEFFNDSANWAEKGVDIACMRDVKDASGKIRPGYLTIRETIRQVIHGNPNKEYPGDDPANPYMDCLSDFYDHIEPSRNKEGSSTSNTIAISKVLTVMDKLVKINTCQIHLSGETFTVDSLGSYVKGKLNEGLGALSSLFTSLSDGSVTAEIQSGALKDFEQLSGCDMSVKAKDISIKTRVKGIDVTIVAGVISTTARSPYVFTQDLEATADAGAANPGIESGVAQDTYGMAVDYWVRTNAKGSHLVLEGNLISTSERVRATGTAHNGATVELSTVTITTRMQTSENGPVETFEDEMIVYTLDGKMYNANTYQEVKASENQTISEATPLMTEKVTITGYEGENRVWYPDLVGEGDFYKGLQLSVDSTTQGSGSCYVFYAEDPTQQENGIRLLSNLRVAFVDNNEGSATKGKLVAHARLDTTNYYEENGKVILPLVLEDDGSDYLTKTDDGLAILPLEQNVATRLLTLIYLDGRAISNADVLEASEIHGQLNIQFGTTVDLTPARNEKLEMAERKVHAAIKKHGASEYVSNDQPITFNFDEETGLMEVDVRVTVEGDAPTNVSAFFMRKVNATQGSREETVILYPVQKEGNTSIFEGTARFSSPGSYVLQTVVLDGADYSLPASEGYPRVEISGFGIGNVGLDYDGSPVSDAIKVIMTDDRSVSADVSLAFASSKKLPGAVRMQFVKAQEDGGGRVTVIMAYDTTTQSWKGTATFTSSGKYTLQSVILDNETWDLDPKFQKTLDITMGMAVRVRDTDVALREVLWSGTPYTIPMLVDIIDDGNNPVPYLSGARLTYGVGKSEVENMDPDLKWDAQKKCYTCDMPISGPGLYNFINVNLDGTNKLDRAVNTPPQFTCTSPNPPEYFDANPVTSGVSLQNLDYVIDNLSGGIKAGVRLAEASSARVRAVFYNAEDNTEYRSAYVSATGQPTTIDGQPVSEFIFTIPSTGKTPGQTGDWTIRSLELINVYANGKMYRDENAPLTMSVTHDENTNDLHVKVVSAKVTVTTGDKNRDYTGLGFLQTQDTGSITVTITDHRNEKLIGLADSIQLNYQLEDGSWEDYGSYTAPHLDGAGKTYTKTITSTDGKNFILDKLTLEYAGKYTPSKMVYKIGNTETTSNETQLTTLGMPTFTLSTAAPTVAIKSVTPTGTIQRHLDSGNDTKNVAVPTPTATSATVYFGCSYTGGCGSFHNLTHPTVTITLGGIGKASSAELFFGTDKHIYDENDNQNQSMAGYTWTANGDCKRWIGYFHSRSAANDDMKSAGLLTANTLIMKDSLGNTYEFKLATPITINNPAS